MALRDLDVASSLARRQILAVAEAALRDAGADGVIPTPLDAVGRVSGIAATIDVQHLPPSTAISKPPAWKRILGAILFRERLVFVDTTQSEPRRRLTQAHEIGHQIIPWHEGSFLLDDGASLIGQTRLDLEKEAYLAGGHLVFQGQRFMKVALDYKLTIATPIALSGQFGASRHATIRYYIENHPDTVALLVAGRFLISRADLPVWYSVESASFARRHGPLADLVGGRLSVQGGSGRPFGDIAFDAMHRGEVASKTIQVRDVCGDFRLFVAEAFFNRHNLFVMLSAPTSRRFGRRIRVAEATE